MHMRFQLCIIFLIFAKAYCQYGLSHGNFSKVKSRPRHVTTMFVSCEWLIVIRCIAVECSSVG